MRYCSRLQASESLQNKLRCVLRTWACQVTKKPTSSVKREKKKTKEKKNGKKEKIRYIMLSGCPAPLGNDIIWDNSTHNKYNAENRT